MGVHRIDRNSSDWMGDRDYGEARETQSPRLLAAEGLEHIRDDSESGYPPLLKLNRVVDTPRRARPSVGHRVYHKVALISHPLDQILL